MGKLVLGWIKADQSLDFGSHDSIGAVFGLQLVLSLLGESGILIVYREMYHKYFTHLFRPEGMGEWNIIAVN
jgi:hypothetical protein